jgi:hypothetical protein
MNRREWMRQIGLGALVGYAATKIGLPEDAVAESNVDVRVNTRPDEVIERCGWRDGKWMHAKDVRCFGAMVDGVHDDTEAVQKALDWAASKPADEIRRVWLPVGKKVRIDGIVRI